MKLFGKEELVQIAQFIQQNNLAILQIFNFFIRKVKKPTFHSIYSFENESYRNYVDDETFKKAKRNDDKAVSKGLFDWGNLKNS